MISTAAAAALLHCRFGCHRFGGGAGYRPRRPCSRSTTGVLVRRGIQGGDLTGTAVIVTTTSTTTAISTTRATGTARALGTPDEARWISLIER